MYDYYYEQINSCPDIFTLVDHRQYTTRRTCLKRYNIPIPIIYTHYIEKGHWYYNYYKRP